MTPTTDPEATVATERCACGHSRSHHFDGRCHECVDCECVEFTPAEARDALEAFQEKLRRKAQAVEAARGSLIERVREFVEAHGSNGTKTGRSDYIKVVGLDEIERLRVALREYDRVRTRTTEESR